MTAGSIRGYRQHGIGLLEVTLLLALVSVLVVLGIQTLRGPLFAERARDQADALVWADQALAGFAASHGRLPCPASQADGVERCDLGQAKGWLPTATLAADGAGRLPGQGQIRYLVYRHDEDDLTRLQDLFNPQGSGGKVYDFGQINEMDLCLRLQQAEQVPPGPVAAHIAAAGAAGVINIAYGVAAPGIDADSDGSLFDGANAGAGPVLERPDREPGPGYDDRVRVRDFNTLAQALGCELGMDSLHAMARAVGATEEALYQREAIGNATVMLLVVYSVTTLVHVAKGIMSAVTLATAVTQTGVAAAALAGAIAGCVFLFGCGLIAPYTAAVVAAGVAVGLAGSAIALFAAAAALQAVALANTVSVHIDAGQQDGAEMPDWDDYVEMICGQVPNLILEESQRRTAYVQAVSALDSARNNRSQRWQSLLAAIAALADDRNYNQDQRDQLAADIGTYRDRLLARNQALRTLTTARADRDSEVKQLADLQEALAETVAKLASEQDPVQRDFLQRTVTSLQAAVAESQQRLQQLNVAAALANAQDQAAANALATARAAVMAHAAPHLLWPLILPQYLNNYANSEEQLYDAEILVELRTDELTEAEAARAAGQESCDRAIELRDSGAEPGGALLPVWAGAEDILRAADGLGVVR